MLSSVTNFNWLKAPLDKDPGPSTQPVPNKEKYYKIHYTPRNSRRTWTTFGPDSSHRILVP